MFFFCIEKKGQTRGEKKSSQIMFKTTLFCGSFSVWGFCLRCSSLCPSCSTYNFSKKTPAFVMLIFLLSWTGLSWLNPSKLLAGFLALGVSLTEANRLIQTGSLGVSRGNHHHHDSVVWVFSTMQIKRICLGVGFQLKLLVTGCPPRQGDLPLKSL